MTLLDTHVLLWLRSGSQRVGTRTRWEVNRALQANEGAVSAISFWEVGLLREKRRIELDFEIDEWRRLLLREGLVEIPVDGQIAARAASLSGFHRDPADRLIAATAIVGRHRLVTADERILAWPGGLQCQRASD